MDLWSLYEVDKHARYLGLPPLIGRERARAFFELKCQVWQKLQGWKEKLQS